MRGLMLALALGLTVLATTAHAEPPQPSVRALKKASRESSIPISLGQLTPTPEMWFYDQAMRRRSDPHVLVQERAGYDAGNVNAGWPPSAGSAFPTVRLGQRHSVVGRLLAHLGLELRQPGSMESVEGNTTTVYSQPVVR